MSRRLSEGRATREGRTMFSLIRQKDGSLSFRLHGSPGRLSADEAEKVLFALMPVVVDLVETREDAAVTDAAATAVVAALRAPADAMWELWASLLIEQEKQRLRRECAAPAEAHGRVLEMVHAVWRRLLECDLPREEMLRLASLAQARLRRELLGARVDRRELQG